MLLLLKGPHSTLLLRIDALLSSRIIPQTLLYDAVSDVVESGGHWRSGFQIGSRLLKKCYKWTLKITVYWGRGIASPSIFLIGMSYIGWYHVKEHVQSFQNMYGKGG